MASSEQQENSHINWEQVEQDVKTSQEWEQVKSTNVFERVSAFFYKRRYYAIKKEDGNAEEVRNQNLNAHFTEHRLSIIFEDRTEKIRVAYQYQRTEYISSTNPPTRRQIDFRVGFSNYDKRNSLLPTKAITSMELYTQEELPGKKEHIEKRSGILFDTKGTIQEVHFEHAVTAFGLESPMLQVLDTRNTFEQIQKNMTKERPEHPIQAGAIRYINRKS